MTINILPDDVLLFLFHFDRVTYLNGLKGVEQQRPSWRWHRLVHVCRRWRSVIFASPNFLDLKLVCHPNTRVELTGVWTSLPIVVRNWIYWPFPEDYDFNAAIVHPSRVHEIDLCIPDPELRRLASAMMEPFPALIKLRLLFDREYRSGRPPVFPDGFLGESASCLRYLELDGIPIPSLPKLLLSATHLVKLHLLKLPYSGYISPRSMVTCLSASTSLETFALGFDSDDDEFSVRQWGNELPDQELQRPPPPARSVLPALTHFEFNGVGEYLEDLVTHIDAPRLFHLSMTFFTLIDFDTPRLAQFISRTPSSRTPEKSRIDFRDTVRVRFSSRTPGSEMLDVGISMRPNLTMDGCFSSLVRVCTSCLPSFPIVEDFYISELYCYVLQWQPMNMSWLEFLPTFAYVKNLYISRDRVPRPVSNLQHLFGDGSTELLPNLQNLFLEGLLLSEPVQDGFRKFVIARQLSGNPIAMSLWDRDPKQDEV